MCKNKLVMVAVSAVIAFSSPALAEPCEPAQTPSKQGGDKAVIKFFNETQYAVRLYWADAKGNLKKMGLMQPAEMAEFKTYADHYWHMEAYTPDGEYCFGPISAVGNDSCLVRVLFEDDLGVNAGACEY